MNRTFLFLIGTAVLLNGSSAKPYNTWKQEFLPKHQESKLYPEQEVIKAVFNGKMSLGLREIEPPEDEELTYDIDPDMKSAVKHPREQKYKQAEEDSDALNHHFDAVQKGFQVPAILENKPEEQVEVLQNLPKEFGGLYAEEMKGPEEDRDHLYHVSFDASNAENYPARMVQPGYEIMEGPEEDRDHIYHPF
ncbi:Proline-rich acidic protein 1 [Acipenser ruthenus]|uniref:Proline-rich acidic protein 1 n=1 Tax=Acipenser ruthenus TaxID=7906 RepID=A0A662YVP6_ACIRT|nr:Proline-rich acidic protein 1 [Acipenser ruthenus]